MVGRPSIPPHPRRPLPREIPLRTRVRGLLRRTAHSCEISLCVCVCVSSRDDVPDVPSCWTGRRIHDGGSFLIIQEKGRYAVRGGRVDERKRVQRDKDDFLRETGSDDTSASVSPRGPRWIYCGGFRKAPPVLCFFYILMNSGVSRAKRVLIKGRLVRHASRYRGDVFLGTAPSVVPLLAKRVFNITCL